MDMQQFIDDLSAAGAAERSASSQYTLGDLIDRLYQLPPDMLILLGEAESYRGYYRDLAFVPLDQPRTVREARNEAENADGGTFEGYKGGDFTMDLDTPVWYSHYGDCGPKIMGITDEGVILTEEDE
jgi:hypothetical protein